MRVLFFLLLHSSFSIPSFPSSPPALFLFTCQSPKLELTHHRSTALGSALLAGSAIRLHGWDISRPETLAEVNTKGNLEFAPSMPEDARERRWQGWRRAIERSKGWEEGVDE